MQKLSKQDWTPAMAAHLLKRAAIGGTPQEIKACYQLGLEASVAALVQGRVPWAKAEPNLQRLNPQKLLPLPNLGEKKNPYAVVNEQTKKRRLNEQVLFTLQHDWVQRMYSENAPLEKMVLFWHSMLTSAYGKVTIASFIVRQNQLYRQFAFGDYRELIKQVVVDPAMIIYLDIDKNKRLKPNENFARELLEMFTLGEGNYKPELIKHIAKEMVGYWVKKPGNKIPVEEADMKGMEANSGFSDKRRRLSRLVDSIFGLRICGDLLCRRLWKFYVSMEDPPKGVIEHLTVVLRKSRWSVASVLKEIFSSQEFYSEAVVGQQIKSPVQYLLQSHKEIEASAPDLKSSYYAMKKLGQSLFNPPNVAGWPAGETWINGTTLSARYQLSALHVNLIDKQRLDTADYYFSKIKQNKITAVEEMVGYFFAGDLPAKKLKIIILLTERITSRDQVITLIEYFMCMPEYQLC